MASVGEVLRAPLTAAGGAGALFVGQVDRVSRALVALVVQRVLDQLDLTALVRQRVDLDAVAQDIDVDAVAERIDLDRIVDRVDIDRIIDRVDIDRIIDRVDIGRIIDRVDIDGVAAKVDVDAIVGRVDLIGLANYVVDGIDLPGIIRESSGSMASEALSGVRMQSLAADEAITRVVNRWLPRRRAPTEAP